VEDGIPLGPNLQSIPAHETSKDDYQLRNF
jgi:hypothetical protein